MTKLLDQAIERLRTLPNDRQDEVAEVLMSIVEQEAESLQLTPEQRAEVARILREPAEHFPHEEVKSRFKTPGA